MTSVETHSIHTKEKEIPVVSGAASGFDLSKKDKEVGKPRWEVKDRKIFALHMLRVAGFVLFSIWVIASWIFGSISRQSERGHNLKILLVDLDGADIGTVVTAAAQSISGKKGYATFAVPEDVSKVTVESAYHDVWKGDYWGALIINANTTSRLTTAVMKGDTTYNSSSALTFVWNEVRWALVSESIISPSVTTAVAIAQKLYAANIAPKIISSATLNQTQATVLLNPFTTTAENIYSFSVGIKPFINTVGFVFPGLVQFFFAMGYMGVSSATHMTTNLTVWQNYLMRFVLSRLWGFIMGISWSGWFFIFAEERTGLYDQSFILLALNMWIYNMISYEYHDACAAFIPLQLMPISVITWIIMNISAAAFPIQLKPSFFRFDYAVPSYNCFELFITIMTRGSTNRVYRNVPVLFAWLIVTGVIGIFTNRKRCRQAKEQGSATPGFNLESMMAQETDSSVSRRSKLSNPDDDDMLTRIRTENEEVAHDMGFDGLMGMGRL